MQVFDGNYHAQLLDEKILEFLQTNPSSAKPFLNGDYRLGIVQIGDNSASETYMKIKRSVGTSLGLYVEILRLPDTLPDSEILDAIHVFFSRSDIFGGLIQLPLPRESLSVALGLIPDSKDLDILAPEGRRKFYAGDFSRLPPVVRAFDYFLEQTELDQTSPRICIVGYGSLVGMPIAHFATLSGYDSYAVGYYSPDIDLDCDLLVLSTGSPELVSPADLAQGVSVVDFGFSRINGHIVGDLAQDVDPSHLGFVSLARGGMGPLVVRFLFMNFLGI